MLASDVDSTTSVAGITDLASLHAAVNVAAGHRNALDGQMVDIAVWLLEHDEWKGEGLAKPEQYLAFRCGLSPAGARRYVEVARRAAELPRSVDALRTGELSLDQLMPIVRRVPGWADSQVLSLAKRLTVGQINAVITKYDFTRSGHPDDTATDGDDDDDRTSATDDCNDDRTSSADPSSPLEPGDSATTPTPADRCWHGVGDDGRWRLHVETSRDVGMAIESAIRDERDRRFRASGATVSDAEALAGACRRSVDTIDEPARRERYRTNIHLHTDGQATDHLGQPLPDAISRHITCDGLLNPVFHEAAKPTSVGRTQRIVPERTRKQVLLRDGGCRVPGCWATNHLDIHHIIHWFDLGPTDTPNLIALCPHHHRMHHQGRLGITGDADDPHGVTFTNRHGVDMSTIGVRPEPPAGPSPAPTGEFTKPLGERLDMHWVAFAHPERLRRNAEQLRRDAIRRDVRNGAPVDPAIAARFGVDVNGSR